MAFSTSQSLCFICLKTSFSQRQWFDHHYWPWDRKAQSHHALYLWDGSPLILSFLISPWSTHYFSDPIHHSLLRSLPLSISFMLPTVLMTQPNSFYPQSSYKTFFHFFSLKPGSLLITQQLLLWCQVAAVSLQQTWYYGPRDGVGVSPASFASLKIWDNFYFIFFKFS